MALITCFDDLSDLALIELFSYLSSFDILWGFSRLNYHLTMLITERGFFHHVNLSLARYHQFNTILGFLPLNDIQSLSLDSDASPLQLTHWPYLPRLRILRVIGAYNHDQLLIFILLHAATLTHIIIKSSDRLVPDGLTIDSIHPIGDLMMLVYNILLIHLPALRSLDFGLDYYWMEWNITVHVPLTYLRLSLISMDDLVRIMSTQQLSCSLRHLHVTMANGGHREYCIDPSTFPRLCPMMNLHTFTFFQSCFSGLRIEWTFIEMLTSSNVMPVLRRANMSLFININDINHIDSSSLFIDHRHVDVHFAFSLIDCPQYMEMTQYIPHGNRFRPREIVGTTFVVSHWSQRSEVLAHDDPLKRSGQYYHHMWYTLPWRFDEFFHVRTPNRWITKMQMFEIPQKITTIKPSSLRTLDASGSTWTSSLFSSSHIISSDDIETLHLSCYNLPIPKDLSALRSLTLVNSINCLNYYSSFPSTIRSIRIFLVYIYAEYMLPDWSTVCYSLSTLRQLSSLRIFIYDVPKTVDDDNCQMIAQAALMVSNFCLCFRSIYGAVKHEIDTVYKDHTKFIRQLCHCILLLSNEKKPCYSIENDGCGLTTWF